MSYAAKTLARFFSHGLAALAARRPAPLTFVRPRPARRPRPHRRPLPAEEAVTAVAVAAEAHLNRSG